MVHMPRKTRKLNRIYQLKFSVGVEGKTWRYQSFISWSDSQVAPWTKWFLHKTIIGDISLFLSLLTCRYRIFIGTSAYERLSSTPYPHKGIMYAKFSIRIMSLKHETPDAPVKTNVENLTHKELFKQTPNIVKAHI